MAQEIRQTTFNELNLTGTAASPVTLAKIASNLGSPTASTLSLGRGFGVFKDAAAQQNPRRGQFRREAGKYGATHLRDVQRSDLALLLKRFGVAAYCGNAVRVR